MSRPSEKPVSLKTLETALGHTFDNQEMLCEALTHPSIESRVNYQRLEFLGDRVLGVVIGNLVYKTYPQDREGQLSRRQAALVRKETLAQVARDLGVGRYIRMTDTALRTGGRDNPSILADVIEALIGALYLDAGLTVTGAFIEAAWAKYLNREGVAKDPKSALQEWAQGRGRPLPAYTGVGREGPDHAPRFIVEVTVEGLGSARAEGASKQEAETLAAEILIRQLTSKKKPRA